MASLCILEEGCRTLKSCNIDEIKALSKKLSGNLFKRSFLKEGVHYRLLKEARKLLDLNVDNLSRCHLATSCLPTKEAADLIPLR